jgi:hypothetical protein
MIELRTSVKQDDTTRTRTPKPGYLKLTNFGSDWILNINQLSDYKRPIRCAPHQVVVSLSEAL